MRKGTIGAVLVCAVLAAQVVAGPAASWIAPPNNTVYDLSTGPKYATPIGNANCYDMTFTEEGLDLGFVIDASSSMAGVKLQKTKEAAIGMIEGLPFDNTQVAVVAFDTTAETVKVLTPLNPNKQEVIDAINSLTAEDFTNIGAGVIEGAQTVDDPLRHIAGRNQVQVLISEGRTTFSVPNAVLAAQTGLNMYGVTTHAVQVPDPDPDPLLMQQIANAGGGVYTNVSDIDDLLGLFDGSEGNIVGLEKIVVTVKNKDGEFLLGDDYPINNGLGHFSVPDYEILLGDNLFTVEAFCTNGDSVTAQLNLIGVPEPMTMAILGLGGLLIRRRK